jgi:hypothetical protein
MMREQQSAEGLTVACIWEVRELANGVLLARRKNVMCNAGLTNFASAWQGNPWPAPIYLVLESLRGKIQNAGTLPIGATSVSLDVRVDLAGDTSIILGVGTANQETVPFSGVTGTGPYVYTISATTKTHLNLDPCVRVPLVGDTMAGVQSEIEYDHANNPSNRLQSLGGYAPGGTGAWTMQYFLSSTQALYFLGNVGLADSAGIGTGNLHNHVSLGLDRTSNPQDLEFDITLTLSN